MFQHLLDRVRSKNVADRRIKIRFFADLYYEMRSFGYGGSAEGSVAPGRCGVTLEGLG